MTGEFQINPTKTYATKENARKAVIKKGFDEHRHFIMKTEDDRWLPVFVGERAVQAGIHFHFHIVG